MQKQQDHLPSSRAPPSVFYKYDTQEQLFMLENDIQYSSTRSVFL